MLSSDTSGRRLPRFLAAAGVLTVAALGAVVAPAVANGSPSFTVTDAEGQPFTVLDGTEGSPLDVTLTIDPDDDWVLATQPGWSFGILPPGVSVTSFEPSGEGDTYIARIQGTPETGYYANRRVTLFADRTEISPYQVRIAPLLAPTAINLDAGAFRVDDVTVEQKGGAFTVVPTPAIRRPGADTLIPFTYADDGSFVRVKGGEFSMNLTTETLYDGPEFGEVSADAVVTGSGTSLGYRVVTNSRDWEGAAPVGDVVLAFSPRAADLRAQDATDAPDGQWRLLLEDTSDDAPVIVVEGRAPVTAAVDGAVVTLTSPSSEDAHLFSLTVFDYQGCAADGELLGAFEAGALQAGDYVAAGTCPVPDPNDGDPGDGDPREGGPGEGGPGDGDPNDGTPNDWTPHGEDVNGGGDPDGGDPIDGPRGGGGPEAGTSRGGAAPVVLPEAPGAQTGGVLAATGAGEAVAPLGLALASVLAGMGLLVLRRRLRTTAPGA